MKADLGETWYKVRKLRRNGRLTWNNEIPENEVHIRLGRDAGGGSFKMAFQNANLRHLRIMTSL